MGNGCLFRDFSVDSGGRSGAIVMTLGSVAKKLGAISEGLKVVEQNTAPLNGGIEKLNGSLSGLAGGLMVAETSFVSANEHLQETLDAVAVAK